MEAAARIIDRTIGRSANPEQSLDNSSKTVAYSIRDSDQFIYNEPNLDEAAKILRLLQVHSTRNVQTAINEAIVSVQQITANPKTDTKLGKVGF